jgi:hypothetical protein
MRKTLRVTIEDHGDPKVVKIWVKRGDIKLIKRELSGSLPWVQEFETTKHKIITSSQIISIQ